MHESTHPHAVGRAPHARPLGDPKPRRPRAGPALAASGSSQRPEPIPFNLPFVAAGSGRAMHRAARSGQTAGAGPFTRRCEAWACEHLGAAHALLTSSCTAALEMCALLLEIGPGDEVIVPAYTFVSTANAFALRGATLRFADSQPDHPNVDPASIASLLTPRTRAIVIVHYGGLACQMQPILELAQRFRIPLIEDAAQAIGATWRGRALGTLGTFGTLSFHETKNIACGEGGMLLVNDARFSSRAEVVREKGTNRASFYRREVAKYSWVDLGSSFLVSDIVAALLLTQLTQLAKVTERRRQLVGWYRSFLPPTPKLVASPPDPPGDEATPNGHIFFLLLADEQERNALIATLRRQDIHALFHYLALNESPFAKRFTHQDPTPNAASFTRRLVRLPLYFALRRHDIRRICHQVRLFATASRIASAS